MSEIDSLVSRIRALSQSVDFWNSLMLWGLALAAVAAVFVVIATRVVVSQTGKLSDAQELLSAAKDRQLALDLKDKDRQIEKVKSDSALDIARLKKQADDAEDDIANTQEDAAKANQRAAEATKAAEDEKIERLKLEALIAPRRLTPEQMLDLRPFFAMKGKQRVRVSSYTLDAESGVLAGQIVTVLQQAGMEVEVNIASTTPFNGFALGVHVTGSNQELAMIIAASLRDVGHLQVAPYGTPEAPGASMSFTPQEPSPDVEILVGPKPLSR